MNNPPNGLSRIPPYLIFPDFLSKELIEQLFSLAIAKQTEFKPSQIDNLNRRIDADIRISQILRDFDHLFEPLKQSFQEIKQQAMFELKLSAFELAHCEIELAVHEDGAFYKRHIDTSTNTPDAKTQRVMTGVLYFHQQPRRFDGGQLRLYSLTKDESTYIDIEPEYNSLVLFPAWAPHEVLPVSCPSGLFEHARFAINCWYRRANPLKNND